VKVVVNAGPLMVLGKLGQLELLYHLYGEVHLPSAVHIEVVVRGLEHGHPDAYAVQLAIHRGYLIVVTVNDTDLTPEIAALPLDAGEKQTLHLALQEQAELLFLDELKARTEAQSRGLTVKGTLGVIVEAYRAGLLQLDEVETLIEAIIAREDIWISAGLCRRVLAELKT
jgi:predicted nucleic acid-binding protein